jgi:hypothetical protein
MPIERSGPFTGLPSMRKSPAAGGCVCICWAGGVVSLRQTLVTRRQILIGADIRRLGTFEGVLGAADGGAHKTGHGLGVGLGEVRIDDDRVAVEINAEIAGVSYTIITACMAAFLGLSRYLISELISAKPYE